MMDERKDARTHARTDGRTWATLNALPHSTNSGGIITCLQPKKMSVMYESAHDAILFQLLEMSSITHPTRNNFWIFAQGIFFKVFFRENIGDFTELHNEKINLEVTCKRKRFGFWNLCKRLPNFVNVAALVTSFMVYKLYLLMKNNVVIFQIQKYLIKLLIINYWNQNYGGHAQRTQWPMSRCVKNILNNLTALGAIFMHFHQICEMHILIFGGHACESTWLHTMLLFLLLRVGLCIEVNFILAYTTIGSYVSRMSTYFTFATVYKGRHCH